MNTKENFTETSRQNANDTKSKAKKIKQQDKADLNIKPRKK